MPPASNKFVTGRDESTKHNKSSASPRRDSAAISVTSNSQTGHQDDSSATDGSNKDEADGDQSDGLESDVEDESDEDPDVFAPSGVNINQDGDQAGQLQALTYPLELDASGKTNEEENNSDDDDDYQGVDLISDSEQDCLIERSEEEKIIASEDENDFRMLTGEIPDSPPWLSSGLFIDDVFDEQIGRIDGTLARQVELYRNTTLHHLMPPDDLLPRRRVHFADPLMLPSEAGSVSARDIRSHEVPKPFMREDTLCTSHRDFAEIEKNLDTVAVAKDSDPANNDDASKSCGSSSGYETDQGETTDEEDVPASATTRPQALLRHPSASLLHHHAQSPPDLKARIDRPRPSQRRGPTLGSWVADPTKPIAIVDSSGKRLIIYPAQRPQQKDTKIFPTLSSSSQSSVNTSPRVATSQMMTRSCMPVIEDSDFDRSELSSQDFTAPMLSASPNLMMTGLLHGVSGGEHIHRGGQFAKAAEVFYPWYNAGPDGKGLFDDLNIDNYVDNNDDDDGEGVLNVEDFINFGEDSEGSDHETEFVVKSDQPDPNANQEDEQARQSPTVSSDSSARSLLEHFDKGVVTAFRRNQYSYDSRSHRLPHSSSLRQNTMGFSRHTGTSPLLSMPKKRKMSGDYGLGRGSFQPPAKKKALNRN